MTHILLYGPPASGKSTIGEVLASNLGLPFVDLDNQVQLSAGMEISQIMSDNGESSFRDFESAELKRIMLNPDSVIALGGGSLLRDENRSYAESHGEIICLDAGLSTLLEHLVDDPKSRPLLAGDLPKKLAALLNDRAVHYNSFQNHIETDGKTLAQIAWQIQIVLGRYHLSSMGSGYDVIVQSSVLDSLGELLQARGMQNPIVVTDANVAIIHAELVLDSLRRSKYFPKLVTLPAGETYKTLETITCLWREFLTAGIDRKSTVIALGGGVIGDMAGFAAATFMRGVDWVVLPTTLLSIVDASLGGKTGFDLPEGKNLIGSFHSPRLVLADPQILDTLPEAELRSGLAEVVKHGIIADPVLFELTARGLGFVKNNLNQILRRAVAVKIKIIEEDPYERGLRAALNLGHTLGHALEMVSGFRLRHGEAVAIGMVVEAKLAENLKMAEKGLSKKIAEALSSLGLPVELPKNMSPEELIQAMQFDKKKKGGIICFALPVEIGRVQVDVEIKDLELLFKES
jgi:3-dehydroquinate synthase